MRPKRCKNVALISMKIHCFFICVLLVSAGCTREPVSENKDTLVVSVEQASAWTKNFNPLFPGGSRWPTGSGIYEPLMIFNSFEGRWIPWLAQGFEWSEDQLKLTVAIRDGVKWSDGTPFTALDVQETFTLMKKHRALDGQNVWKFLESVRASTSTTVEVNFNKVYSPGFAAIMHQVIVPSHVFSKVKDPVRFTNPNPVGTGPFTELSVFRSQVYELEANPHYWNGPTDVRRLRMPAYGSNDSATLAMISGELDWAGHFIPAVDKTFVARNPAFHQYWFPLNGPMVFLYLNTQKPPFDRPEIRKALSMAINRKRIVEIAMYNYTRPGNATGLSDIYKSWRDESAVKRGDWIRYDFEKAKALLESEGFQRGPKGELLDSTGKPIELLIEVVSGWSDWVRAAQVVADDLKSLGISASVKAYEFSAWFERLQKGDFQVAISWSAKGATPYDFYRTMASKKTLKAQGELSPNNWHRFADSEMDKYLDAFESTNDPKQQALLAKKMQHRFVDLAPAIPLFPNPSWGQFSTRRFTNFPTQDNAYADLSPVADFHRLLVLTRLKRREN